MRSQREDINKADHFEKVNAFLKTASGLKLITHDGVRLNILQQADGKSLQIDCSQITEIIFRNSQAGEPFLQVNFELNKKILLTDSLIGFKPAQFGSLDMNKLPKVVTTPDLLSVVEALEEALTTDGSEEEVEMLKKVFEAVLQGAESIGFDLHAERLWIQHLGYNSRRASA